MNTIPFSIRPMVLVVDDVPDNLLVVSDLLREAGYAVRAATSGPVALRYAAQTPKPDVILLDVMMPGDLDGYQVCARVKADTRLRGTRVVMLTARGQKSDLEAGAQAGADAYLTKPFSPLELIDTVERLLEAEVDTLSQQAA